MNRITNHLLWVLTLSSCARPVVAPDPDSELGSQQRPPIAVQALAGSAAPSGADGMHSLPAAECGNGVREGNELCDGSDCPTACTSTACVHAELRGAAATCDVRCVAVEIDACASGDGCCPSGCNHATDADCSPSCGDGIVSANETCEPRSADHPCPTTAEDCDDGDPCTQDKVIGSAQQCSAHCTNIAITHPIPGDRCCPAGANISTDADCVASCGDGVISAGEQCDPALPGSCPTVSTCDRLTAGCRRGVLVGMGCAAHCEVEDILKPTQGDHCCPPGADVGTDSDCEPRCGDGVVSADEECDPSIPAGGYGRCPARDEDCSLAPSDPCQKGVLVGDPNRCTAHCSIGPRVVGERDACCPSGATSASDPDCAPACGNGIVEDGETCDSGPGSTHPCPTARTCPSETCNARRIVGSGCSATCEDEVIAAHSGDGCCPAGATASTDSDCHDGVDGYWAACSWPSVYAPGWTQDMPLAPPSASRLYGCDGADAVCMSKECVPTCRAGDTRTPDGWEGYCLVDAHPPIFEIYCGTNDSCPAPRQCIQTSQNARKLCR